MLPALHEKARPFERGLGSSAMTPVTASSILQLLFIRLQHSTTASSNTTSLVITSSLVQEMDENVELLAILC
jgi:hypothetical protein